jgi:uncharacterized protein
VAMRPPIPNITLSRRAKVALWTIGVLIVVLIALVQATGVYVNWLWFGELHYRGVYTKVFWTRVVLFFVFGVLMALIIGGNLVVAYILRPPFRPMSAEQQNIERYRVMFEPRRILILAVICVIALFSAGMSAQGNWATWQLFLHGGSFRVTDPQFHKDISFYAWDYPAYRLMLGFGFTAIIFALILSAAMHYLTGAIRLQTPGPKITLAARRHLTILVFVFLVLKAIAYWLDRYGLVFSDRSKFTGASYTDVHAALPARTILFWIALLLAAGMIASLWLRSTLVPAIGFIAMLILSILISGIYPALVQSFSVKPNASSKEVPYIARNIAATRDAYGIVTSTKPGDSGKVTYDPYPSLAAPDTTELSGSNPTVSDIRILDPNVLSRTFTQYQQIRNVYGFARKLDMDRYSVDGQTSDYVVGVRELDQSNLTGDQTNWINEHTNYTHGYGFVAAKANVDVTDNSAPYSAYDIPQKGTLTPDVTDDPLKQPRIYFGELLPDYSIVGARGTPQEYDGSDGPKVRYGGSGGVSLSSFFTRLAFAVNYKQTNFVLNNAASASGAKIIFNRDPRVRVKKVAPYLSVDGDPYPVIDPSSGHIVWMVDGYTTMNNFPYSQRNSLSDLTSDSLSTTGQTAKQPNDQINYIRNSVKATVDAYTGQVTLYAWDASDPVLQAWMHIFPGTVKPASDMPDSIRAHVRYPQDLFKVQRQVLGTYHVDDPVVFYNVGDKWTVPVDPNSTGSNQPPYYVLAAQPGSTDFSPEFQLTSPMIVNSKNNLAAYISVNNDPGPDYGKITVLKSPTNTVTYGPEQVSNILRTNPTISQNVNLLDQGDSSVIHGNLLTLPVGDAFLYVEPLYVQSTANASAPLLQRVLVVYGNRIGFEPSLALALEDLMPGHHTGENLPTSTGSPNNNGNGGSTSSSTPPPPNSSSSGGTSSSPPPSGGDVTVQDLSAAEAALQAALKSGDFAQIGTAQAQLNELLQKYLEQNPPSSSSSSGSPRPSGSGASP